MSPAPLITPAPETTPDVLVHLVTTTIWESDSPPQATLAPSKGTGLPLAPIIGGTVAGFCFACVMVFGWVWWGKCIKRKEAKRRKDVVSVDYTMKIGKRFDAFDQACRTPRQGEYAQECSDVNDHRTIALPAEHPPHRVIRAQGQVCFLRTTEGCLGATNRRKTDYI
jgi:hypothetical protein